MAHREMMPIPYGRQDIDAADIEAVVAVLRSDFLTQGPTIQRFEEEMARACSAKFAVAVSNATAALHIAYLAAGLKKGDFLWTSPNTFLASANAALYCQARPDFVDIDPLTYNMSVKELEARLAGARVAGTLPSVVVPVHFAGQPCEMARIAALAEEYGFTIVEDASHAVGASYKGQPVGSCAYSAMAVFSFHPVKIMTTGEGGLITTNRKDLYEKLLLLRSHGMTRDPASMTEPSHGPWFYQQVELGFNFRMTDLQAALGLSQLRRLSDFIQRRRFLFDRYSRLLADQGFVLPNQYPDAASSHHLYVVQVPAEKRRPVFEKLRAAGIGVNVHYIPIHTQPYYKKMGFKGGQFPESERYYSQAISLPIFYGMTDEEQDFVVDALKKATDRRSV